MLTLGSVSVVGVSLGRIGVTVVDLRDSFSSDVAFSFEKLCW